MKGLLFKSLDTKRDLPPSIQLMISLTENRTPSFAVKARYVDRYTIRDDRRMRDVRLLQNRSLQGGGERVTRGRRKVSPLCGVVRRSCDGMQTREAVD